MTMDNLWQFRFVDSFGDLGRRLDTLGKENPIVVESYSYPDKTISALEGNVSLGDPCAIVRFNVPATNAVTLTGRTRILCSSVKFVRDPEELNTSLRDITDKEFNLDPADTDTQYTTVVTSPASTMVYVSICFEADSGIWYFSPQYLMGRTLIRRPIGMWGDRLFASMPVYQQAQDDNNEDTLLRIFKLFGSSLDDAYSRISRPYSAYDYERIDAAVLPFIDRLIGWPTNFELPEDLRRRETGSAVDLWKAKGSSRALELVMQRTIGWDVEIFEGWRHVARTAYRTLERPADWIEGEIDLDSQLPADQQPTGIWDDLSANQLMTWSARDGVPFNSVSSTILVLPSPDNDWKNTNGVLIRLYPSPTAKTTLTRLAIAKAKNLIPLFVLHSADVYFAIVDSYQETMKIGFSSEFDDDFGSRHANDIRLDILDHISKTKSDKCLLKTWTLPEQSTTNDTKYRLYHSEIEFTCDAEA